MRAISNTSASDSGLPAGSAILTAYAPPDALASRISSTRGRPANRGAIVLDTASGGDETLAASLGTGVLGLGRTGSPDLGLAREPVPVAALDGVGLSTGGVPLSRGEVTAPVSPDVADSVAVAPGEADPRVVRSRGAGSAPGARTGAGAGVSVTTAGACVAAEVSAVWAG